MDLHAAAKRSAEAIREQRKRSAGWTSGLYIALIIYVIRYENVPFRDS